MMNLNDVKIVGNLVREPEIRHTPNGVSVANLSLGVNESYLLDGEKRQVTTFVDVQAWGATAQNLARLATKGQEIFVEGTLRQDTWEDKETGKNRSRLFVKAERWQFTQYRAAEEQRQAAKTQAQGMER